MQHIIEKQITLPKVSVQLVTVQWGAVEEFLPLNSGYHVCQRLSDNHSALRIGNCVTREAFPRVRSVGFLPPDFCVELYPVDQPFRALTCIFNTDFFETVTEIQQDYWHEHSDALVSIKGRRLETMMQEIHGELVQPGFAHDVLIEAASAMILVEMGRYGRRLGEANGHSGARQGLAPWQLRRIHERIEASLEIGYPSLDELARLCGISQSHLMRTFKVSTGWQIHKYIAEERMRAAKAMLSEDQLHSKEISARLGFRSPAYFATAFLRMTGKTPTEYRRQSRSMDMVGA
ncbi:MAG: AraC family transcriptional regulator [Burkholderiales bacterium]